MKSYASSHYKSTLDEKIMKGMSLYKYHTELCTIPIAIFCVFRCKYRSCEMPYEENNNNIMFCILD